MGRTIPTSTTLLAMERAEWKAFRMHIPRDERKLFDEMFDIAHIHNYAMMMSMPSHPIRLQPIMMSIIFHHYKVIVQMISKIEVAEP